MRAPESREQRNLRVFFVCQILVGILVVPLFAGIFLGLSLAALGWGGVLMVARMQVAEVDDPVVSRLPSTRAARACITAVLCVFVLLQLAIPRFDGRPRSHANESAAIATLRNLAEAQNRFRDAGAIDRDGDGIGEFGYFAELAGATPPLLSGAFLQVRGRRDGSGGVIERSGYLFQIYLPDAEGGGLAEMDEGGVSAAVPDADRAERAWCCYAWPIVFGSSGHRVFFVNQEGDVLRAKNIRRRYSGDARPPAWSAALEMRAARRMSSRAAVRVPGVDEQVWTIVN